MSIYDSKEDAVKWEVEQAWLGITSMETAFTRGITFGRIVTLSHFIGSKLYNELLQAYEKRRKELAELGR